MSQPGAAPGEPRPRRRLRRLLLLAVILIPFGLEGLVLARAALQAVRDLHPPRAAVDGAAAARLGLLDVAFQAADGVRLAGWYAAPRVPAVVLLVHGHGGSRDQLLGQAAILQGQGFGVLLFDLRAHGQSGGTVATSGDHEQRDVEGALAFLRARPELHGLPVGAVGFSAGGIALAEVAARDPSVAALVLESTPATLQEDYDADYPRDRPLERLTGALVHRLAGVNLDRVRPVDRVCALAPRPLLLVYGAADPGIPRSQPERLLAAACGPASLWLVEGAGHGRFMEVQPAALAERLVTFFTAALLRPPAR